MAEMAPEAMEALSAAVRRLRALLEADLASQLERRFRLSVPAERSGLVGAPLALRASLEGWLAERARARPGAAGVPEASVLADVTRAALSEVAARTLLQLVLLRQLEASRVSRPAVLTGGWSGKGYLEFRAHAPGLTGGDYEGLDTLLGLLFDELAVDLPGLYGAHPLQPYVGLSPGALRELIAALNAPSLETAWQDDTTLGWVYQFWNDPQREAIDARVGPRGRVGAHEIASKTQLFTERYMVDWLLENSVGRVALAMRERRAGVAVERAEPPWPMFVRGAAELDAGGLPARLADLTILDPACGSGHFLAGAFDLLVPLYREEARDTGTELSDAAIAERILRHNLHGIDLDPRAVQVAAAVLYLKARRLAPGARIPPMNLVATAFDLDGLPDEDPALQALSRALPGGAGEGLAEARRALRYVGFRGSLTRFGPPSRDLALLGDGPASDPLELLLGRTRADDLGVRSSGLQLAAGLRLRALLVEGRYDVVAFNPPYLATAKIDLPPEVLEEAFGASPDLFAAFVERTFELCKPTGLIAFVALSNWMFLSSFQAVRERVLAGHLLLLADLGKGAFRRASKLIQSAMVVASPAAAPGRPSLGARLGSRDAITTTQTAELAAALAVQASYAPFDPSAFAEVEGAPLLFWLAPAFLRRYGALPKVGEVAEGAGGIATTDNDRFLRAVWEVPAEAARAAARGEGPYLPYLKGAEGREWLEPYRWLLRADRAALELRVLQPGVRVDAPTALGVAYTTIGQRFGARLHTVPSVRDVSGASLFPGPRASAEDLVCAVNRTAVRELASALNPTINFQLGDVRRLPFDAVDGAASIVAVLLRAFAEHERGSELSVDYRAPGPSSFGAAQAWAQAAVDRAAHQPLPDADLAQEPASPWRALSHALGVALGRFAPEGGLATTVGHAVPSGILFLSPDPSSSSLSLPACAPLREAWAAVGASVGEGDDLATYLERRMFAEHRRHYEGRPIYLPLSSSKRSFVAYVCVHRFASDTLSVLLADHLLPQRRRLLGELADLGLARQAAGRQGAAERRFGEVQRLLGELSDFIAKVTATAEQGPPPSDDQTPAREVDARFAMELDDGVVVSCAALWPLLEPQWKEPRRWWRELAEARGKGEKDWSRVAARYFPSRVKQRCGAEPSLAVAHGCLWALHPAHAYAWELRLQGELRPDFAIDEPGAGEARASFLAEHAGEAAELRVKEERRRARLRGKGEEREERDDLDATPESRDAASRHGLACDP
jgi:hypothetical protein